MKTVKTRNDITWHFAEWYLYNLGGLNCVDDAEFKRLYTQLCDYVDSKIATPYDGDIIDEYVIVEQEDTAHEANAETPCTGEKVA